MKSYINHLVISGFKAFQSQAEITFGGLTVLAGANSVGKSTVIQSILLSRLAHVLSKTSPSNSVRIPLNGPFMLALGNTKQIATSKNIILAVNLQGRAEQKKLNLEAEVDQTYLILKERIKSNLSSVLNARNFHYLNAERIGPRPFHESSISELPTVGYQGEFAVPLLVDGLSFDIDPFKNFHSINKIEFESPNNLMEQTQYWMNFVMPGIDISTKSVQEINRSIASFNSHSAANVGFGISYVLPIIVAGLIAEKGSMLIVENPEAHLHPFSQSKIGQFITAIASAGIQVVVETHSEHVVNGIRVASMNDWISHSEILINFFERKPDSKSVAILPIEVNNLGDLSDFPVGFFDQSAQDMIAITKKRREKR